MKKSFILITVACVGFAVAVLASDYIGEQGQFGAASAVKNIAGSRWSLARVATTTTSLTSITNTVLATPGFFGKLVIVPGSTNDIVEVHNAASITTATASNEMFRSSSISQTVGLPVIYDLQPGWDAPTGITVVLQPGSTSAVERVFISYDKNQ